MFKVLVVDDVKYMRQVLKSILSQAGFEIVGEAENGLDAFEKYKELKPDLVTLDISMPEKNGIEVLKDIMEYDKTARVIMCAASSQKNMLPDAMKNGARDFISKPFNPTDIVDILTRNSFNHCTLQTA
ncbi:MAG: response regulator [Butyrivibrio sp.]|nr:response regulator [Butyrivibrio sp.]